MRLKLELWGWTCLCVALTAGSLYPGFAPHLSNDAYQYLSVAHNTLTGHFGSTSLIHFDSERSFGTTPAPMVHFPLGYPFAIALVALAGIPLQTAALLVSALSMAACAPLLFWVAGQLGIPRWLRNIVVAGFVFNALILRYGASALSESLFTFLVLLGVAGLLAARLHTDKSWIWRWALAGLAFGAAYWVRYAGLFFIVGLGVLFFRHLMCSDRSQAKGYALAISVAGVAVLAGFVRNFLLVGNWRGFTEKKVSNPIVSLVLDSVRAVKVLFLGPNFDMPAWTAVPRVLFIASFFLGMAWLTWSYFHRHRKVGLAVPCEPSVHPVPIPASRETRFTIDLLVLVLVYCGFMFYAGLVSTIGYDVRMFVPLTPLFMLLIGLLFAGDTRETVVRPSE